VEKRDADITLTTDTNTEQRQSDPLGISSYRVLVILLLSTILVLGLSGGLLLYTKMNEVIEANAGGFAATDTMSQVHRGATETIVYNFGERYDETVLYDSAGDYFGVGFIATPANFDDSGVYRDYNRELSRYEYDPELISRYGLSRYNLYVETTDPRYLDDIRPQVDWLVTNIDPITGTWVTPRGKEIGGTNGLRVDDGWPSALSQGQCLSLLARAYLVFGDKEYQQTIELACAAYTLAISQGGLTREAFGHQYFETYPVDTPVFQFKGYLASLIGLHDASRLADSSTAEKLYTQGIQELEFYLPFFDTQGISLSNLSPLFGTMASTNVCSPSEHHENTKMLSAINQNCDSTIVSAYAKRWIWDINGGTADHLSQSQ
jgi:hypothetical protein